MGLFARCQFVHRANRSCMGIRFGWTVEGSMNWNIVNCCQQFSLLQHLGDGVWCSGASSVKMDSACEWVTFGIDAQLRYSTEMGKLRKWCHGGIVLNGPEKHRLHAEMFCGFLVAVGSRNSHTKRFTLARASHLTSDHYAVSAAAGSFTSRVTCALNT